MFLKQNSLSPINDATIAYIDSLIAAEKDKIEVGGNKIKLKALEADRAEYIVSVSFLSECFARSEELFEASSPLGWECAELGFCNELLIRRACRKR
jgi:hypothetical protein